jgi:hypothetical protein
MGKGLTVRTQEAISVCTVTTRRLTAAIDDVTTLLSHVHRKNKSKNAVVPHLLSRRISLRLIETAAISESKDTLKWC